MKDEFATLRQHVEDLECRLDEYHERLADAARERDEIALNAAWGIVQAATQFASMVQGAVFGVVGYLIASEFGSKVFAVIVGVITWFVVQWILENRSNRAVHKARTEEREALPSLPEWKSEAEKLWR